MKNENGFTIEDIANKKFNRLRAIKFSHMRGRKSVWFFKCDCGIIKLIEKTQVKRGHTKSCGCLSIESITKVGKNNTIHGHSRRGNHTKIYKIWKRMKNRITNFNYEFFNRYGGRGIKICDRWLKFKNFRDDMYESYLEHVKEFGEKQTTIERIDNDGNYEPSNCKWSTKKEQARNKSTNRLISMNGKTQPVICWAEELNISASTISTRLSRGWDPIRALIT